MNAEELNAEELVHLYRRVGAVIALIRFNYRRGFRVRAHNIPVRTNIDSQLIALDSITPNEKPLRKNCFQTTEYVFENHMYDYSVSGPKTESRPNLIRLRLQQML